MLDFLQTLNSAANQRAREWRETFPERIAQPNLKSLDTQGRQMPSPPHQRLRGARPFRGWLGGNGSDQF